MQPWASALTRTTEPISSSISSSFKEHPCISHDHNYNFWPGWVLHMRRIGTPRPRGRIWRGFSSDLGALAVQIQETFGQTSFHMTEKKSAHGSMATPTFALPFPLPLPLGRKGVLGQALELPQAPDGASQSTSSPSETSSGFETSMGSSTSASAP